MFSPTLIRQATEADIPRIVELGSQSLADGPYAGIIRDVPEQTRKLAAQIIDSGSILLYQDDSGKTVGLFGYIVYPQVFTGESTANEIMWYVEPEARKGGAGLKLLWEAEKEAKAKGAVYMGVTSPTDDVSALYSRFGYKQLEVSFMRKL